jgi:hypothetical protein
MRGRALKRCQLPRVVHEGRVLPPNATTSTGMRYGPQKFRQKELACCKTLAKLDFAKHSRGWGASGSSTARSAK